MAGRPLTGCDWLVRACLLDDSTRGLIDARRMALLPATARLANVAPHNCAASLGHEDRMEESFLPRLGPWLRDSRSPRQALPEVIETNRHTS